MRINLYCPLYADFFLDPKMDRLSAEAHKMYTRCLSLAAAEQAMGCLQRTDEELIKVLSMSYKTGKKCLSELYKECLLSKKSDGKVFVANWEKRQISATPSAVRVRRYREKKRNESVTCNVTGTLPYKEEDKEEDKDVTGESVRVGSTLPPTPTPAETPPHSPPADPESFRSPPHWGIPPAPATPPDKHRLPSAPPPGPVNPACPPPRPAASPPLRPDHPADGRPPADLLRWKADPAFALGFAKAYPATGLPAGDAGMAEIYQLYRRIVAQRLATPDRLAAAARAYATYLTGTCRPAKSAANWLKFAADGWDANWQGMTEDYHTTRQKQAEKPAPWLGDLSEIQLAPGEKEIIF